MTFNETFNLLETRNFTPAYSVYMQGAEKIWNRFSGEYTIRVSSVVKARKGTNRQVEIYRGDNHLAGVAIGLKTSTLYVSDDIVNCFNNVDFEISPQKKYRITCDNVDDCIAILETVL